MAVREASKFGVEIIEVDVVPTKDGRVVAFHDERLPGREGIERGLIDREGVIWETPWRATFGTPKSSITEDPSRFSVISSTPFHRKSA